MQNSRSLEKRPQTDKTEPTEAIAEEDGPVEDQRMQQHIQRAQQGQELPLEQDQGPGIQTKETGRTSSLYRPEASGKTLD